MANYPPMPPMPPIKRGKRRAAKPEPVFVAHPPVINHPPEAWHHQVPYPYRFKWDGGWIFIVLLVCGGVVWKPLFAIGLLIAGLRALVWCCMRFPLSSWFLINLVNGLFGGRRRW